MTDRFSRLPLLILMVTLGIIFYRLMLGEAFFWGLPSLQFYPWREYAFDLLRNGHLPLWNVYNGAGAPLLANYQSALLYPLNWSGFFLPLAWSMSITSVLHLFIAGWGMWVFTGRLGVPSVGRGISALAFGLAGYLVGRLGTYPTMSAAAWLPWVLWAVVGILTQFRRRDVGWLGVFAALQLLAGHAQTTWYSMLLVGAFAAWWGVSHRPFEWRRWLMVLVGLILGAGIAAAQLLPTGELLAQSQRSGGVDYDFAMNFSYSLPRTLNFFSPNVFGTPADGTYIAKGAFFEDAVYIGLLPLVSALVALISWIVGKIRRTERPPYFVTVPFWLLIVIIGFVFALGENSPVFPFLYRNIPTFSLFQAPVRWHIWTVFALSVLAGVGVGSWGRGYWLFFSTRLAIAACIGAALLAFVAPRFLPPDVVGSAGVQTIIRAVITTGILGALAGVLTLTQPETSFSRWYRLWAMTVWIIIAADLGYAAQGLNPTVSTSFYDRRQPADNFTRAYWPAADEEKVTFENFLPFDDYRVAVENASAYRSSGLANLNLIDRVSLLNNFDPLRIGTFDQYIELIEAHPAQRDTFLQAAGVDAVYNDEGGLEFLSQPVSKAWFVESICFHSNEASLIEGMLDPNWQPLRQVHMIGEGACPPLPNEAAFPGEVLEVVENGNELEIKVNYSGSAWLVVAHADYPGWNAYHTNVNGVSGAPVLRANLAFQVIPLSSSDGISHDETILLRYEPKHFLIGLMVSLVSLPILLVLFRSKTPS